MDLKKIVYFEEMFYQSPPQNKDALCDWELSVSEKGNPLYERFTNSRHKMIWIKALYISKKNCYNPNM